MDLDMDLDFIKLQNQNFEKLSKTPFELKSSLLCNQLREN
jgi:hypothetical protein